MYHIILTMWNSISVSRVRQGRREKIGKRGGHHKKKKKSQDPYLLVYSLLKTQGSGAQEYNMDV